MKLYHGSNEDFKTFDPNKIKYVGCNGDGFYFTPDKSYARTYGEIVKCYEVNIKNPLTPETKLLSLKEYEKIISYLWRKTEYRQDLKNYGFFEDYDFWKFLKSKSLEMFEKESDYIALFDLVHTVTGSLRVLCDIMNKVNGFYFDGVISKGFSEYVAFNPNQIKEVV